MLRFPFAWYGRWAPVPPEVQGAMELAYRERLGWPASRVDDAIAVGSMAMTLLRLERITRIASHEQPAEMAFRRRTQIIATIGIALSAASQVGRFPALCDWLDRLAESMRGRWSEARQVAAPYPAFREQPRE